MGAEAEELQTDRALAHAAGMVPPKRLKYDKDAKIVYTETRKADITVFEPLIAEEHKKKARYFIPPDDVPVVVVTDEAENNNNSNVVMDNIEKALKKVSEISLSFKGSKN